MFSRGPNTDTGLPKPITSSPVAVGTNGGASPSRGVDPFERGATVGSSVIGTDLTILGDKITIISQNKLHIDGDIRGDINGRQVIIGEEGSVIGTISADSVEVRGGVKGAIRGTTVVLHPTAQVDGDITHSTLAISEGAQFDGRVRRAKDGNELTPNLDVSAFEQSYAQIASTRSPLVGGQGG